MKGLYRRLAVLYGTSALLVMLIFALSFYLRGQEENKQYLYQLLESVDHNLDEATEAYEAAVRRLTREYTAHAREAAYILEEEGRADRTGLEKLRELMGVGAVSLLDKAGVTVLSTEEALEGTCGDQTLSEELWGNGQEKRTAVRVDEPDFWDRPAYFYAAAPMEAENFAAVRIDGDMSRLDLTSGAERVRAVLKQATTEYSTSIFAAGKARGLIIGITENNSQEIQIRGVSPGEPMIAFMEDLPQGELVVLNINGASQSAVVRERQDMYLAAFRDMGQVAADIGTSLAISFLAVAAVCGVTLGILRYFLQKYFLDYFEGLGEGILGILQGKERRKEQESAIPELRPLEEMIRKLERGYVDKAEGMDRMEGELYEARNQAEFDGLTGLYNRKGFERRAEQFFRQPEARGVLLLMDLDNFKQVNDREGHPEGDRLLIRFARCLSGFFSGEDLAGRLGGDEFMVLLRDFVSYEALEEKLRCFYGELRRSLGESPGKHPVSVSIGAVAEEGGLRDYQALYRQADTALYIAKYLGKDRYYINREKISCMRRECVRCRENCPRSRILEEREVKPGGVHLYCYTGAGAGTGSGRTDPKTAERDPRGGDPGG